MGGPEGTRWVRGGAAVAFQGFTTDSPPPAPRPPFPLKTRPRASPEVLAHDAVGLVREDDVHGPVHAHHHPGRGAAVHACQVPLDPLRGVWKRGRVGVS